MYFMGRNIGGGDQIFKMDGTILKIHSWSPSTRDVYAMTPDNEQVHLNVIQDQLTWEYPFVHKAVS